MKRGEMRPQPGVARNGWLKEKTTEKMQLDELVRCDIPQLASE